MTGNDMPERPERLYIADIDYLADLYKEVKIAYLTKAIQRTILDGNLLIADHQTTRGLIQPVLEHSLQGKPVLTH